MSLKRKPQKPRSISFTDVKDIVYSHKLTTTSQQTADNYVKALSELEYFFEDVLVKDLTVEDAYDFLDYLLNDKVHFRGDPRRSEKVGLSKRSVNTYLTLTKGAYTVLKNLGYIEEKHDVFKNIKQLKFQKVKLKTIKPAELKKLIRSLDKRYYTDLRMLTAIYVFLESFGRVSEVMALKVEDIDFDKRLITFNETKNSLFRVVPVSKQTTDLLAQLIEENGGFNTDRIFLTNVGNPMGRDSFSAHLKKCVKRANLKQHITCHMFRHTTGSQYIENGGDIRTLMQYMGHSDISVTQIYLHSDAEKNREKQHLYSPLNMIKDTSVKTRRMKSHRRKF